MCWAKKLKRKRKRKEEIVLHLQPLDRWKAFSVEHLQHPIHCAFKHPSQLFNHFWCVDLSAIDILPHKYLFTIFIRNIWNEWLKSLFYLTMLIDHLSAKNIHAKRIYFSLFLLSSFGKMLKERRFRRKKNKNERKNCISERSISLHAS